MNGIPNIPPKLFTISAVIVAYFLLDDSTANEQNAIGNWLMLVSQVLCTNATYKQLQQSRGNEPSENTYPNPNNSNYQNYGPTWHARTTEDEETLIMLEKIVNSLQK